MGKVRQQAHDMPVPSEEDEQAMLFRWAECQSCVYPELALMFHVPNGGLRSFKTAVTLKRTGLKAGVPDICLPVPRGNFHGMYIEMKRKKGGRVSEEQTEWLDALSKQGYYCIVAKGWEIAREKIKAYLQEQV